MRLSIARVKFSSRDTMPATNIRRLSNQINFSTTELMVPLYILAAVLQNEVSILVGLKGLNGMGLIISSDGRYILFLTGAVIPMQQWISLVHFSGNLKSGPTEIN